MDRSPRRWPGGPAVALLVVLSVLLTACGGQPTATARSQVDSTLVAGSVPSGTNAAQSTRTPTLTLPSTVVRGSGGNLRLLWWQAPTMLNLHLTQSSKDIDASRFVEEPLATYGSSDALLPDVPVLAKEIPSAQNGELATDGRSVTWKLRDGVVWSDGVPFTADDVVFTWRYITDPKNGATTIASYRIIQDVAALDPVTVRITFTTPTAVWALPFVGSYGAVLPQHLLANCTNAKDCPYNFKPVGTGPYVVATFTPGDTVRYEANSRFRETNAPYFATIELKGGGDAATALKAVQTGQADYAWNPQVAPDLLQQFQASGGVLEAAPGASVEKIYVNFTDPRVSVQGERSSLQAPNPFFADKSVRQALTLAIDRNAIAQNLYGASGIATNSIVPTLWNGPTWAYDPTQANMLLDKAGWTRGPDGVRSKEGKRFAITMHTLAGGVRDREAEVIKSNLSTIGIAVELQPVDSAVLFGRPDAADSAPRFEADLQLYSNGASAPDAQGYLESLTSAHIPQRANNWDGFNMMRWANPAYDQIVDTTATTRDSAQRVALFKQADQILVGDGAQIPLVARTALAAHVAGLQGVNRVAWDSDVWNIAHWIRG